jgi:hypothetical protein
MSLETKYPGMKIEVMETEEMKTTIVVELAKLMRETSTGKSHIVANTGGWKQFNTPEGTYKINCLIIRIK